jgi:hypothetical protein
LIRNAAAAVGLLLVAGSVFAFLGPPPSSANDVDPPPVATEDPEDAEPDDPAPGDQPPADPGDAQTPDPDTAAPNDDVEPDEQPNGDPSDDSDAGFAPSTISIQVLDGYQRDGGTAASAVTEQLRDAGYQIVAENPAIAYEVTTVLWTAGFEEQARQVAREIGASEVREQPGNLSTQVAVHVVVGADRG